MLVGVDPQWIWDKISKEKLIPEDQLDIKNPKDVVILFSES